MSRGKPFYQSYNYSYVAPQSQGVPNYNIPMYPFMGQVGGGYYPTGQGHSIQNKQPYMNQSYQGPWNQMETHRIPFIATLNLPDLSKLTNDPGSHDLMWLVVPANLPFDIPKFEGKNGEDPRENVTTFHLCFSSNSLNHDSVRL